MKKGTNVVTRRSAANRHSKKEIGEKLARAEEMAREGKTQNDIASVLGISVMTFHRWRKEFGSSSRSTPRIASLSSSEHIRKIEAENARLRDLVARMLLENESLKERA